MTVSMKMTALDLTGSYEREADGQVNSFIWTKTI